MNKRLSSLLALLCVCLSFGLAAPKPGPQADLSRLVFLGDSLSAGVQNFALLETQQPNGYASLLAEQAGVELTLPLVPYPGAPNVLQLVSVGPPPVIQPVPGTLPYPRSNPGVAVTNLSIPGIAVGDALLSPDNYSPLKPNVIGWAKIVLGFPPPPAGQLIKSQLQQAIDRKPTTVVVALGNNDALVPAISGLISTLTPATDFRASFQTILSNLAPTGATLIVANIPDVTQVPYFTSARTLARESGLTLAQVTARLGIGPDDYVRSTGVPIARSILAGNPVPSIWPGNCPEPVKGLLPPGVPLRCVLTAADAARVRAATASYNAIIREEAANYRATLVDLYGLVERTARTGYRAGKYCLTTGFLGGLFSLDGIHPGNTGYALIANEFIETMNANLGTKIKPVKVSKIAKADPLVLPSTRCGGDDEDDDK